MSEELKPEILQTTQTLLTKHLKKPPLTEKLLKKPPFRYLHDIVTSIIKETGFLNGLYSPEEMNADNIRDKAAKMAFLDKLIAAIKLTTGINLTVKSSKIVSGLEVARTHELLQAIGQALDSKADSKNAVEEVLNKRKSAKESNKTKTKEDSTKRKSSNENIKRVENQNSPSPRSSKGKSVKNGPNKSPTSSAKENVQSNDQMAPARKEKEEAESKEKEPAELMNTGGDAKVDKEREDKHSTQKETGSRDSKETNENESGEVTNLEGKGQSVHQQQQRQHEGSNQESSRKGERQKSSPRDKKSTHTEKKLSPRDEKRSPREQKSPKVEGTTPREEKAPPDKVKPVRERAKNSPPSTELRKAEHTQPTQDSAGKSGAKHREMAVVKDKREDEKSARERAEKESPRKDRTKKDSRPSSARPGSRKPLKANHLGSVSSNVLPASSGPSKPPSSRPPRPSSALKRPPSAGPRPPSARPGAPRIKDRGEVLVEEPVVMGPVNLIRDGREEREDEEMVIVETVEVENQRKQSLTAVEDEENTGKGQLVSQILETQKVFEESLEPEALKRTQIEWEGARKKGREATTRDIEKLKANIQDITRSALPLGQLMNFHQEDVQEIERELSMWKKRSEELRKQLNEEKEKTSESIEPLKLQLEEIESKIIEEAEQVALMKMKIYKNDQRIQQLLKSSRSLSGR